MSELKTLRDVAGLGQQPGALRQSALILIDCQNTYREGLMQLEGVETALDEARRLLTRARSLGINLGYRPTVVADATATRALPTASGGIVSAKSLQEASLATLFDLFAVVVSGADDLPE